MTGVARNGIQCRMLALLVGLLAFIAVASSQTHAQTQFYAAPTMGGDGSGTSATNPAGYGNATFWNTVQTALNQGAVTVTFLDGTYVDQALILRDMGHAEHRLVLGSQTRGGAVFDGGSYLQLRGVQNTTVRDFGFTGNHPDPGRRIYKLQATSSTNSGDGTPSRDILFQGNLFYDAPTYYGAIGVAHLSHHVTIYDNDFRNVGGDSHAHMIYTAHDGHHVKVIGNRFEDTPGDYVRFRDNMDFGEVRGNTFRSTSSAYNRPFVQMPVFNDVNPGDEVHASNYLIRDNSFVYESTAGSANHRNVMGYLSSGYEPVGLNYLPSVWDGLILEYGTPALKRELMLDTMNIDLTKVRVYGNDYQGHNLRFRYAANASYGAPSQGWTGEADIYDAINTLYLGAGDIYSDGKLGPEDLELFLLALEADDELAFLLDNRVWFGDYAAADINGDGRVDQADVQPFIDLFADVVPESQLAPLRALIPEPGTAALLAVCLGPLALRRRR